MNSPLILGFKLINDEQSLDQFTFTRFLYVSVLGFLIKNFHILSGLLGVHIVINIIKSGLLLCAILHFHKLNPVDASLVTRNFLGAWINIFCHHKLYIQ